MKHEEVIQELQDAAAQLGVTVRFERGDFEGGYCILRDKRILIVNRRLMPSRKASILAAAMSELGLDNVFLKPVVRAYVEDELARQARSRS
jgi:hypothetical protein